MPRPIRGVLGVVAACSLAAIATAADPGDRSSPWIDDQGYDPAVVESPRPELRIPRLEQLPTLEDFVDRMAPSPEFEGQLARVDGGFVQRDPEDGNPASQHTDVYMAYDATHLVVVFVAFDDEPDKIRARLAGRENAFSDELVEIQLDTFLDRRRAYTFGCNPLGVQWDAIWEEGREFDSAFDTVWDSRGRVTDRGFVVWMRIPFKSLRFPRTEQQTWGFLLVRDIKRNDESSFYPRMSKRVEGRIQQAGTLVGLEGISPGRNIQMIPYGTAASYRALDASDSDDIRFVEDDADLDAGIDAKAVLRDRVVVDATVNPDFSQIESDAPQVTVNQRFEVFFPERRPFFVENAGYFQTPINLVFTRRIVDPRFGLRTTGKLGRNGIGVLWIDDEAPGRFVDADDPRSGDRAEFRIARWSREVGEQSNVGAIYTERRFGNERNQVAGADVRWKIDDHWVATAQAVGSRTRDVDGREQDGHGAEAILNRSGRRLGVHAHARDYDQDFRADAGFVPRVDQRDVHAVVGWTWWPEGERLISWTPTVSALRIEDHQGVRLERTGEVELAFQFRRQTALSVAYSDRVETLRPADFPSLAIPRDYDTGITRVEARTAAWPAFEFGVEAAWGDGIQFETVAGEPPESATVAELELTASVRPVSRLRVDFTWLSSRLDDDVTSSRILSNDIARARVEWQFDRRASLRLIARHDVVDTDPRFTDRESTRNWNTDVLFRYLVSPWTALYVGYNSNETNLEIVEDEFGRRVDRTDGLTLRDARQVFVKFSYLFRL